MFELYINYQIYQLMDNPESTSAQLTPKTMYNYDHHSNIPWNILQYKVPAIHNDYKQITRDRVYASQKKGVKTNDFYITKRGFYMDYDLKVAKGIPSSVEHIDQNPWDGTQTKLQGDLLTTARSSKKYTYLERLEKRLEMHPIPGVASYSLQKPIGQINKLLEKNLGNKLSQGQKRYFYEDTTFLSNLVPGAGSHNPHDDINKIKATKGDWKMWTTKHTQWNNIVAKREKVKPAPGTYSPLSQQYRSFSFLEKLSPREKQIKNGFGSDSRFVYTRPNKKVIIEERPAPSTYQTKIDWKGKSVSPKKMEWIKMLWKGSQSQVYH